MGLIELRNLTKKYRSFKKKEGFIGSIRGLFRREYIEKIALNAISLTVNKGDFIGFAGPNGAGKTTMLKILSGILHPTQGTVSVNGYLPSKRSTSFLKQITFVAGNKTQLEWSLPPMDSYLLNKEIYDIPERPFRDRVRTLATMLNLHSVIHRPVRELSLGERMKSELLAALLHDPEIIFLDEPTIGLDVNSQRNVWRFLEYLNQEESKTIILTSHYVEDIRRLCKRIVLINEGNIVFDDSLPAFLNCYSVRRRITFTLEDTTKASHLKERFGAVGVNVEGSVCSITVEKGNVEKTVHEIMDQFEVSDLKIEDEPIQEIIAEIFENLNKASGKK